MAENINSPPKKTDLRFDEWLFQFWSRYQFTRNLANAIGILGVGNGGTGTSDTPANGELLIGNGTGYTVSTLTAGSNITITNGAGSIQIAASGGGGGDYNIDGGVADSIYTPEQLIDGGDANG
jgi:hypothetical protein